MWSALGVFGLESDAETTSENRRWSMLMAGPGATGSVEPEVGTESSSSHQEPAGAVAAPEGLSVAVSPATTLTPKAQPGDMLFVCARAAEGPRMPLAIVGIPRPSSARGQ